jgi:hypothetical protein
LEAPFAVPLLSLKKTIITMPKTTNEITAEQAKIDSNLTLDELFVKTKGYPLKMPLVLIDHLTNYQKAYHAHEGTRINRDKLLAIVVQRSLQYLEREATKMEKAVAERSN